MKKHVKIILTVLIVAVALTTFGFVAFGEGETSCSIEKYNLAFKDSVYISYAVKFENVPDGAECGILVWDEPQSSYTVGVGKPTKITESTSTVNFGSGLCYVYDYAGVSAKEMSRDIYTVAYVKDGDEYTYSKMSKYSVLQYAYNKLGYTGMGTPSTDEEFKELLNAMLKYGAAAQEYFGYDTDRLATAQYQLVYLTDGTLSDRAGYGLYLEGAEVTVTAEATKDGAAFAGWTNSDGEIVSTSTEYTFTVPNENVYLTATYAGA